MADHENTHRDVQSPSDAPTLHVALASMGAAAYLAWCLHGRAYEAAPEPAPTPYEWPGMAVVA